MKEALYQPGQMLYCFSDKKYYIVFDIKKSPFSGNKNYFVYDVMEVGTGEQKRYVNQYFIEDEKKYILVQF